MKIIPASPYTDVRPFKGGNVAAISPGLPGSGRRPVPNGRAAVAANRDSQPKRFNILLREAKRRGIRTLSDMKAWAEQELKSGGYLAEYFAKEKATGGERNRAVRQQFAGRQRHFKGDAELKAIVPAREFFRWRQQDKHFWEDDSNLRSLKRDNPDMLIHA